MGRGKKKRQLSTPEKVCDSPSTNRPAIPIINTYTKQDNGMSGQSQTQMNASVNPTSPSYGFVQQLAMNQPQGPILNTPVQTGQQFQYGMMNQPLQATGFTSPSQQIPCSPCTGQFIQQTPTNNYQQQQLQPYHDTMSNTDMSSIIATLNRLETKIDKLDTIERKVSDMSEQISSFERRVTSLEAKAMDSKTQATETIKRVNDIEASRAYESQVCEEMQKKITSLELDLKTQKQKCESLLSNIKEVKNDNHSMREDILDVQSRSMRDNLIFHGIKEWYVRW